MCYKYRNVVQIKQHHHRRFMQFAVKIPVKKGVKSGRIKRKFKTDFANCSNHIITLLSVK